jgi:hypothetical protein
MEGFDRCTGLGTLFPDLWESTDVTQQPQKGEKERGVVALQAARRPTTQKRAHDQPQVERGHVHSQTFENIRVAPQMDASHPARFIAVRKAPFHLLAPLPQ